MHTRVCSSLTITFARIVGYDNGRRRDLRRTIRDESSDRERKYERNNPQFLSRGGYGRNCRHGSLLHLRLHCGFIPNRNPM
jgi:hypothetical protein